MGLILNDYTYVYRFFNKSNSFDLPSFCASNYIINLA